MSAFKWVCDKCCETYARANDPGVDEKTINDILGGPCAVCGVESMGRSLIDPGTIARLQARHKADNNPDPKEGVPHGTQGSDQVGCYRCGKKFAMEDAIAFRDYLFCSKECYPVAVLNFSDVPKGPVGNLREISEAVDKAYQKLLATKGSDQGVGEHTDPGPLVGLDDLGVQSVKLGGLLRANEPGHRVPIDWDFPIHDPQLIFMSRVDDPANFDYDPDDFVGPNHVIVKE